MDMYKKTMDKLKLRETAKERAKQLYRNMESDSGYKASMIRREEMMRKGKIARRVVMAGAAVCLAVVAVTGVGDMAFHKTTKMVKESHAFTFYVNAAELEEGKSAALVNDISNQSWALGGLEDGGMSYVIGMPVTCTGDDIDTITYEINKGAFDVVTMPGDGFVVDGELYDGELNTGSIGCVEDAQGNIISEENHYKAVTVSYNRQSGEQDWISICGETDYFDERLFGGDSLADENDGFNRMLDGVEITCTVHFKDGTLEKRRLAVGSEIKTCGEAGDVNGVENEGADMEDVYIVYMMK